MSASTSSSSSSSPSSSSSSLYKTFFDAEVVRSLIRCFPIQEANEILVDCSKQLEQLHDKRQEAGKIAIKEDKRAQFHASFLGSYIAKKYTPRHPGMVKFASFLKDYIKTEPVPQSAQNMPKSQKSGLNVVEDKEFKGIKKRVLAFGSQFLLEYYMKAVSKLPQGDLIMSMYHIYIKRMPVAAATRETMAASMPEEAQSYYARSAAMGKCIARVAGEEMNIKIKCEAAQYAQDQVEKHRDAFFRE